MRTQTCTVLMRGKEEENINHETHQTHEKKAGYNELNESIG
jgi:hypothetical protein